MRTTNRDKVIHYLVNTNLPIREIARKTNTSTAHVYRIKREMGLD